MLQCTPKWAAVNFWSTATTVKWQRRWLRVLWLHHALKKRVPSSAPATPDKPLKMKNVVLALTALLLASALLSHRQTVEAQTPQCLPPPGQTVNDFVDVQTLNPDGFAGPASSTNYRPTGETLTVHTNATTYWLGVVQSLADVRIGVNLQVAGTRQSDCSVIAIKVLSSAVTTPTPSNGSLPSTGTGFHTNGAFPNWALVAAAIAGLSAIGLVLASIGARATRPRDFGPKA
jgi:hypothetical protein